MSAAHTPGPWHLNPTDSETWIYDAGCDRLIARVIADRDITRQQADARVIAAAPKMLEALQIIANSTNLTFQAGDAEIRRILVEAYGTARAALAEAVQS